MSNRSQARAESKNARRERRPLGTARQKLEVEDRDEAYRYRWILEERTRFAIQGGYEPVLTSGDEYNRESEEHNDMSSWTAVQAGKTESGKPRMQYLMRIRREWYEEDQKSKQAELDKVDAAILHGVSPVENPHGESQETTYSATQVNNQFKR